MAVYWVPSPQPWGSGLVGRGGSGESLEFPDRAGQGLGTDLAFSAFVASTGVAPALVSGTSTGPTDEENLVTPATTTPRRYRTLFISDLHLGTRGCQVTQLLDFLS